MADIQNRIVFTATDKTQAAFRSMRTSIASASAAMTSFQGVLLQVAGIGGLVAFGKATADAVDKLAKVSDKLGVTTQAMAGLQHAASLAGVENQQLEKGLQQMAVKIGEAAQKGGDAAVAFSSMGLSARELRTMAPEQQFSLIADKLNGVSNATDRINLAYQVFGARNVEFLNLIEGGSAALAEASDEAERLGLSISRIDAAKVEIANDAWTRFKGATEGAARTVLVQLTPYLKAMGDMLTKATTQGENFGEKVSEALNALMTPLGWLADGVHGVQILWQLATVGVAKFVDAAVQGVALVDEKFSELASKLPGLDFKPSPALQDWAEISRATVEDLTADLEKLLMEELPSEGLKRTIENVKAEMDQAAAEIAQRASGRAGVGGESIMPTVAVEDRASKDLFQKYYDNLIEKSARLEESLLSDEERIQLSYENQLMLLDEAEMRGIELSASYNQLREQIEIEHQARLGNIFAQGELARRKTAQMNWQQQFGLAAQAFGGISNLMQGTSKRQFEIGKKAAIAETVINTAQAAMKSYQALSGLGPFGPALGAAAAAAAIAYGVSQVQKIKSTQFGGGASAGGGPATPTYDANPGTGLPAQPFENFPGQAQASRSSPTINLTIESDSGVVSTEWVRDKLLPRINEAIDDGVPVRG